MNPTGKHQDPWSQAATASSTRDRIHRLLDQKITLTHLPGFMRFLEAALNPFHDEHEEVLTWCGKPFDPDDIAERYVRMALTTIANRRRGALMRHRASTRGVRT